MHNSAMKCSYLAIFYLSFHNTIGPLCRISPAIPVQVHKKRPPPRKQPYIVDFVCLLGDLERSFDLTPQTSAQFGFITGYFRGFIADIGLGIVTGLGEIPFEMGPFFDKNTVHIGL